MKQEFMRYFFLSFIVLTLILSACYLRPADEPPMVVLQNVMPEMAYQSLDDTTYSHENGFEYWDILDSQGKMFYDAMWNFTLSPVLSYEPNLYRFSPEEEFDAKAFSDATKYFIFDHPEKELLYFINMSVFDDSDDGIYQDFGLGSFVDKEEYERQIAEIEKATFDIIKLTNAEPDRIEKYKLLHDWIICNVQYDFDTYESVVNGNSDAKIDHNINNLYGALVNKLAVCDGISDAFKYLCNQCDLECITVQGEFPREKTTSNKVLGHQWNLVYDGHRWLMVDCTFDMSSENPHNYFMIFPNIDGRISWYSLDY